MASAELHRMVRTSGCDLLYIIDHQASVVESVACVQYEGADLVPCHGRGDFHTDHPLLALLYRVKQKLSNCLWMYASLGCQLFVHSSKITVKY